MNNQWRRRFSCFAAGLCAGMGASAFAIAADELWVANWNSADVRRFVAKIATAPLIEVFVPPRSGGLSAPHFLSFGPDANLYVASWGTSSVLRYDGITGEFTDAFVPSGSGGVVNAHTTIWHPEGLLVAAENSDAIHLFDADSGEYIRNFADSTTAPIDGPELFIYGPHDGNIYLSNKVANTVIRLAPDGTFIDEFVVDDPKTPEDETGGLRWAHGLCFSPHDGNLLVASSQLNKIIKYDGLTGELIGDFVAPNSGGLSFPLAITFGPRDHLFVASYGSSRVKRYDGQTGEFLNDYVNANGGLNGPSYIVFLPDLFNRGDLNCDGQVNAFDIEPFLLALFDPDGYPAAFPRCQIDRGDINEDGSVDAFDIEPFLDLLFP